MRARFHCELRPAARGEFVKPWGWIDKSTKQQGILLYVGGVHIDGTSAEAGGGYSRYATIDFKFNLSKEGQAWRVSEASFRMVTDPL